MPRLFGTTNYTALTGSGDAIKRGLNGIHGDNGRGQFWKQTCSWIFSFKESSKLVDRS